MTDLATRLSDEADQCRNDGADDIARLLDEAAVALRQPGPALVAAARQALEALEQANAPQRWPFAVKQDINAVITALRAALAEQDAEQAEPVAWAWALTKQLEKREATTRGYLRFSNPQNSSWEPLFRKAPAPARQEPLTDDQITDACRGIFLSDYRSAREYDIAIARAIERAHNITAAPAEGDKQ